ncbi:8.6 kDa transglutaminase substrate-like [Stegodyphus dumicola]|uniref:8.6 kDa transglutaminase substrate-like n=1 Tax=Stegodyphus dumicola TaxID=202533 RepID=UPI0015AFBA24|nr:8.6 kDa transglutaminase substrate-like [Stegodyphus dumicola]
MNVECFSEPDCSEPCDESTCKKEDCKCGSYLDECNCCSICYKCPGEECYIFKGDACAIGSQCTHPEGTDPVDRYNEAGACIAHRDDYEE